MEKLDLESFRSLKQEIIEISKIDNEESSKIDKKDEEKLIERYKEIIKELSNHDLSDIPFEEWEGMMLVAVADLDINIDFSKTKANLDFSKILFARNDGKINFKGCNIVNFDFEKLEYSHEMFDEKFIEQNKEYFLDEDAPKKLKEKYYNKEMTLKYLSKNLEYFKDKKIVHSIMSRTPGYKFVRFFGEDTLKLFEKYKPMLDIMNSSIDYESNKSVLDDIENFFENMSEEEKNQELASIIKKYFSHGLHINNLKLLKMITDFVPLEDLYLMSEMQVFLQKYDIDELIKVDFNISYLTWNSDLSNLEEMKKYSSVIKKEDLKGLLTYHNQALLRRYSVDQLLEYGIKDFKELEKENPTTDLHLIKEQLEKRPIELINMGKNNSEKIQFIKKYGIDNIIKLDEETNGIFSHKSSDIDMFLLVFVEAEKYAPQYEVDEFSYEEFKDRMYELLLHARDERIMSARIDVNYDFIQGAFREEHPEIFIDGKISGDLKEKFYTSRMSAEDVRQNPELVQLLQGKDLSRVFSKKIDLAVGSGIQLDDGDIFKYTNSFNMAKFLSEKIGQENFLRICADYGKCLDKIDLSFDEDDDKLNVEIVRNEIENQIYKYIKEKRIEYGEYLPESFKEKHPDLFLTKEIDEETRNRFYKGEMAFDDIRRNSELKEILLTKDLGVAFGELRAIRFNIWSKLLTNDVNSKKEILDFAEEYGNYFMIIDINFLDSLKENDEKISYIRAKIEESIINRRLKYNENVPEFFKEKHPELFLSEDAPKELKEVFYDNRFSRRNNIYTDVERIDIDFIMIKDHPEWKEFLIGKDLRLAFAKEYEELFKRFDSGTLLKLGLRNPETIEVMAQVHKEETMERWYKATGGKFLPHHVVMLNFPEDEIDKFLSNGKKWSQLMRIQKYDPDGAGKVYLNDEGKKAILKAAYTMGVFKGDDDAFNRTMKLFTDVPQELTKEEYEEFMKGAYPSAYKLNEEGKYVLSFDKQKDKEEILGIRAILEEQGFPKILTPHKAHQIFDSFKMVYNPDFDNFFNENLEEILSNPEYTKDIAAIQRQFKEIKINNSGRKLTLKLAQDYIRENKYTDVEIGNEGVAEQAKIAGYSQEDFEAIQKLYNEGETRDYSSIPRIQGETNGYTYEMLRCDDPLALTIGTLTDCCQEIHGAGYTSMEHSMVSPDGRVFVVRDDEGRIVAQSWVWRNQYTCCFDNIEIPDRIFRLYEKQHPNKGRNGLTNDVLEVYKKASKDLMQEDERVYKELLENGTITQEQYDSLLLGKVTIGLGYNDIAVSIKSDKTIHQEKDIVFVKGTNRFPNPYTDADTQYTIAEREKIVKSSQENLYVHQDDIPVYDERNITSTVLSTMKRMENSAGRDHLEYFYEDSRDEGISKSQKIINQLAQEYGLDRKNTKLMATARMAMIYSKEADKIKIADLFTAPIKEDLTDEQKQKAKKHIMYQIKKALKQLGASTEKFDISSLEENQQKLLQSVMQEIEKEDEERSEI